ncbi:MAG: hypothetical protein HY906_07595 [Deltaproteobacteria bacterium]|nr:hypothetical protein [Deltaproteobacteria bacterium]
MFPDGLEPEVRPRGAAQVKAARGVRDRLAHQPAAATLREEFAPKLDAAIADLTAKLDARKAAGEVLGLARARENGAQETWVSAYDSNAGAMRTLFPRQRARQDLYFDQFRARPPEPDEEGPVTPPPAPGPG